MPTFNDTNLTYLVIVKFNLSAQRFQFVTIARQMSHSKTINYHNESEFDHDDMQSVYH